GKTKKSGLSDLHLIDILWANFGLDLELVGVGNDQHDWLACGDDAAYRVYGRLEYRSSLWGANIGAAQLIFGRHFALDGFADLAVDVAKLFGYFAAEVLVNLDDLQLGLGDFPLC